MTCGQITDSARNNGLLTCGSVLSKIGPGKRVNANPALNITADLGATMSLILVTSENRSAQDAFEAYAEMRKHEVGRPALRDNPHWQAAVATAFTRFEQEMGAGNA